MKEKEKKLLLQLKLQVEVINRTLLAHKCKDEIKDIMERVEREIIEEWGWDTCFFCRRNFDY